MEKKKLKESFNGVFKFKILKKMFFFCFEVKIKGNGFVLLLGVGGGRGGFRLFIGRV